MIYNEIFNFCKVRNKGNCFSNGSEPTPRVKFLMNLLESQGIEYVLDTFTEERKVYPRFNWRKSSDKSLTDQKSSKNRRRRRKNRNGTKKNEIHFFSDMFGFDDDYQEPEPEIQINTYYNIVMRGTSNKMIIAHHDVNNPTIDNANDNSASVINVIATKKLRPDINAVIVDGEEFGGIGSSHLARQIKNGDYGNIEWVLNYELTGKGGKYFFIGNYPGPLSDKIIGLFNCPVVSTPFNDSVTLRRYGIDSTVINPIPPLPEGQKSEVIAPDGKYLDIKMLYNCHSPKDNISTISVDDMKEFVEEVILKII